MPIPTRRLATVAAALSLVLLALPADADVALVAANAVLLLVAAVDALLAPAAQAAAIAVERDMPAIVALGGESVVTWRVRNGTGRTLRLRLADQLAPSLRAESRRARFTLAPGATGEASTVIRPTRRGRFEPREVTLRVEGPLGLAARQRARALAGVLRVYPPFRSRDEAELRIDRARILEVGLRSAKGRGGGTEFDQLREYSSDDEFRRIDWSATARVGKPIVRTYRAERNQHVLLLLDNGRVMAGRVAGVPRVEHAMDAVMMLTAVATRLGDRTGLVAFDREVRSVVPPAHGRDQLGRVTEAMYLLEPQLAESDYRGAFAHALARFRRRSLLVLLTELVEQAVGETLLPALPLIARHHLVIIGGVRDPAVARWAASEPTDATAAYRKAAAVAALEERARTVARLRGVGATVVDAEPGRLAPLLADAYLRVKTTGRL